MGHWGVSQGKHLPAAREGAQIHKASTRVEQQWQCMKSKHPNGALGRFVKQALTFCRRESTDPENKHASRAALAVSEKQAPQWGIGEFRNASAYAARCGVAVPCGLIQSSCGKLISPCGFQAPKDCSGQTFASIRICQIAILLIYLPSC